MGTKDCSRGKKKGNKKKNALKRKERHTRASSMPKTHLKPPSEYGGLPYMWKYWKSVMADHRTDLETGTLKCTWKTREVVLERWFYRGRNGNMKELWKGRKEKILQKSKQKCKEAYFCHKSERHEIVSYSASWKVGLPQFRGCRQKTQDSGQRQRIV